MSTENKIVPFNSPNGFDLGKIENILISGNKTLSDKLLIVKYDGLTGKYILVPQEIKTIHGNTSVKFVLGINNYNYNENLIFTKKTETTNDEIIFSVGIDIVNKTKGMVSIKGQLLAKHVDTTDTYHNFIFSTGMNIPYEQKTPMYARTRNLYDKNVYLFDSKNIISVNRQQYIRSEYLDILQKEYLISTFSTIGNIEGSISTSVLPYIEFNESTNGLFTLNIKCNPLLKEKTKYINWFGNFELTVTAT